MAVKGYTYSFVEGQLQLDDYICVVCNLVSRDPQQANCCGTVYCKTCLQGLRDDEQQHQEINCANCDNNLQGRYFDDTKADRKIKLLQVYCENKRENSSGDNSCPWKGTLKDIDDHLQQCPYQILPCTNGCKESLQRKQLEDHLENDCLKRITKCLYCNEENIYEVIVGDHFKLCTQLPIKCSTEGCDFMTKRCSMGKHKRECPKEFVTCQYNTIGCHHYMKREEQDEHNEQTIKKHLKMAVKEVEHLRAMLVTLESPVKNAVHQQIQLAGFKEKKESDISWYCPPIYTSPGGYKMRFQIFPNGFGESKGKKLSCLVRLLPGAYDDIMEWPFQGEVTIELLNQLEDRNHIKKEMIYNETTPDVFKTRVVDKEHEKDMERTLCLLMS